MEIIYEDMQFIGIYKNAGVPVQDDQSGDPSCQSILKKETGKPYHILTRLDRPTSGIALFAKELWGAQYFTKILKNKTVDKEYLVAVEKAPPQQKGRLEHLLVKKGLKSFLAKENQEGKKAILDYEVIGKSNRYHFLRIKLITGRFHQIRCQLAAIGCHIKGDVKYGARRANKDRSIHLHAAKISFLHPISERVMNLEAKLPDDPVWNALL